MRSSFKTCQFFFSFSSFSFSLPFQLELLILKRRQHHSWRKVAVSSMNSASLGSFHLLSPPICKLQPRLQIKNQHIHLHSCKGLNLSHNSLTSSHSKPILLHATDSNTDASISLPEGAVSVMNFEEVIEKDWSVLVSDKSSSEEEFNQNIDLIISAGMIEETSRVLVSVCSEEFVDRLVDSSPCKFLLVVHDSLLTLAGIKEKYDQVKCWQGEIIYVPEKWAPLDVVFLYFLPAVPFKLDEILGSLAKKCSLGKFSVGLNMSVVSSRCHSLIFIIPSISFYSFMVVKENSIVIMWC